MTPAELTALEAELRAAMKDVTPGPWAVYDGCSWRRIGIAHGRRDDCAVLAPTKASDGHPDLTCSRGNDREANLNWIARCSPDNIAALLDAIADLRRKLDEAREHLRKAELWTDEENDVGAWREDARHWLEDK